MRMPCLRHTMSKATQNPSLLRSLRPPAIVLRSSLPYAHKLSASSLCRPRVAINHHNAALSPSLYGSNRSISTISAILLPPVVFAGLLVTLWTWKCFMMVLFQNKIIYMPFLPPNARSDTITEYSSRCGGIKWKEEHIKSTDGTDIALAIAEVGTQKNDAVEKVVLYFQGNASSLPPRLPDISQVLRFVTKEDPSLRVKFVGVSYRGYWKSGGRPSEVGMRQDAEAALQFAIRTHYSTNPSSSPSSSRPIRVVIWGQSIGCAFASHLAASMIEIPSTISFKPGNVELETLILETPFTSASEMLKTLYPQKWLPYRYLSVFLWNRLDTIGNLDRLKRALEDKRTGPSVVVLEGEKDELVPREHGDEIEMIFGNIECGKMGFRRVNVEGALHTQVLAKGSGRIAATAAIRGFPDSST